jgi:hypothetical protein
MSTSINPSHNTRTEWGKHTQTSYTEQLRAARHCSMFLCVMWPTVKCRVDVEHLPCGGRVKRSNEESSEGESRFVRWRIPKQV